MVIVIVLNPKFPMKFKTLAPLKVFLLSIFIISQFSCSKDSDLLTDYVLSETQNTLDLSELILDDTFIINSRESITLDVLANDGFENIENVVITEASEPENGTVVINTDNTLTYTPVATVETTPETTEQIEDTFTYTTEVVNEDETVSTGTGIVTVTSENKTPITGDNVYYVSITGKANNDGRSEATAWSIQHALSSAVEGDVVYIKAGNYGAIKLVSKRAGTAANPIKFIGYTSIPGDIVATNGPTYDKNDWINNGDDFDSSVYPLLDWNPLNDDPANYDDAITIKHPYIEFHNIQARDYRIGVKVIAEYVTLNNVHVARLGTWDPNWQYWNQSYAPTGNNGYGIYHAPVASSDHGIVRNCLVIDAGHISYYCNLQDDMLIENCKAYTINPGNGTDYMFEIAQTTNSIVRDCYAERTHTSSTAHTSRLLATKCQSSGNLIENFSGSRSKIQIMGDSDNNIYRNISISGQYAEFQIYGESDDNIIENLEISGGYGISFLGWAGYECGYPVDANVPSGSDNHFINPLIHDAENGNQGTAAVSFHRLTGSVTADAGKNYITGGTFYNFPRIMSVNRPGEITFTKCSFSDIYSELDGFKSGFPDMTDNYKANYIDCTFSDNAFSKPSDN